jgi:hypothetical protein
VMPTVKTKVALFERRKKSIAIDFNWNCRHLNMYVYICFQFDHFNGRIVSSVCQHGISYKRQIYNPHY